MNIENYDMISVMPLGYVRISYSPFARSLSSIKWYENPRRFPDAAV